MDCFGSEPDGFFPLSSVGLLLTEYSGRHAGKGRCYGLGSRLARGRARQILLPRAPDGYSSPAAAFSLAAPRSSVFRRRDGNVQGEGRDGFLRVCTWGERGMGDHPDISLGRIEVWKC